MSLPISYLININVCSRKSFTINQGVFHATTLGFKNLAQSFQFSFQGLLLFHQIQHLGDKEYSICCNFTNLEKNLFSCDIISIRFHRGILCHLFHNTERSEIIIFCFT